MDEWRTSIKLNFEQIHSVASWYSALVFQHHRPSSPNASLPLFPPPSHFPLHHLPLLISTFTEPLPLTLCFFFSSTFHSYTQLVVCPCICLPVLLSPSVSVKLLVYVSLLLHEPRILYKTCNHCIYLDASTLFFFFTRFPTLWLRCYNMTFCLVSFRLLWSFVGRSICNWE